MTPGDVATTDLAIICNGTTRSRRSVSQADRNAVMAEYGVKDVDRALVELDHLVPLALGGSNRRENLWPQPSAEADLKDALEIEMQRLVCTRAISIETAQREIADDWIAAYGRYVGSMGQ